MKMIKIEDVTSDEKLDHKTRTFEITMPEDDFIELSTLLNATKLKPSKKSLEWFGKLTFSREEKALVQEFVKAFNDAIQW